MWDRMLLLADALMGVGDGVAFLGGRFGRLVFQREPEFGKYAVSPGAWGDSISAGAGGSMCRGCGVLRTEELHCVQLVDISCFRK